ncbi:MAG: signal peptidase II [Selenomonadaceae bacterium]|nr:signal peptidase II [Selenomonadaceae bacterium]
MGIIAADQFVKAEVVENMVPGESIPVIENFFHITYVLNPGAAFGILPNQRIFFLLIGGGLLALAAYFYPKLKKADKFLRFGSVTLLGGAAANLIDRARTGQVIDFMDFRVWPVFNIADVAIIFGMFVLFYAIIFKVEGNVDTPKL